MHNISVGNLFPTNGSNYKPLDVYTIYNINNPTIKSELKEEFNVKKLIKERKDRQLKVYEQYKKMYRLCLNKIKSANKMQTYEIIYEVPHAIFRCPEYVSVDCLNYLEKKLKKLKFEVEIVSLNSVYVNWDNIK